MSLKIIKFKKEHFDDLWKIWNSKEVIKNIALTNKMSKQKAHERTAMPNRQIFVAIYDGEIAGNVNITIKKGKSSHVGSVGIMLGKKFWGKKIGSALVERTIEYAKKKKLKRLELEVFPDNPQAIGLYKKFGFVEEGIKRKGLKRGNKYFDEILMGKLL